MGYGDVLLAAAEAQVAYRAHPERGPVVILNCEGVPRWRQEWEGNPAIRSCWGELDPSWPTIRAGKGCSPWNPWQDRNGWRARDQERPRLYFNSKERAFAAGVRQKFGPYVLIEPTGRDRKNPNRFWGSGNWKLLAKLLKKALPVVLVQLDRPKADLIIGVHRIPHESFKQACAVVQGAVLSVMTEGGLAIGAYAVGAKAVVIWGGNADAEVGAYPEHVNIVDTDPRTPCNEVVRCQHCIEAWERLKPHDVADVVLETFRALQQERAS